MFAFKLKTESSELDAVITNALRQLDTLVPFSKEWIEGMKQVKELYAIKATSSRPRVSPDTWVTALSTLGVAITIVSFERANVATSKAWTMATRAIR